MKLKQINSAGHNTKRIALYMTLLIVAAAFLLPLVWMFTTSFKPLDQVFAADQSFLPHVVSDDASQQTISPFTLQYWRGVTNYAIDNFTGVWNDPIAEFPLYLKNTLLITLLSVLGIVISSSIVAYGFSRIYWRGRNGVFLLVIATMMVPFPVLMAPLYVLFKQFGWIGSFKPLWVPAWFGGAFSIFLLRQFFMRIPKQYDEAAMLDGCSRWGILWRIILPLSKPALAVVILFQFIASWNDFVGPLVFLNHQEQFTLSLGLYMYQSQQGATPWNLLMAASVLVILPVLIVFLLTQRSFMRGIAAQK